MKDFSRFPENLQGTSGKEFRIRGFNPCESLLRHTPEELVRFIRRMKSLSMNTIIIHYDYGWNRYKNLILEECEKAGIEIILMTFGPRTFFRYSDWKKSFFAKDESGNLLTEKLECETWPCSFEKEALEAFSYGAKAWLRSLPQQIRHVHMRAADGFLSCRCEKCRRLPEHEKWQVFVDLFAEAVQETRPGLVFETDLYVRRYRIPEHAEAFGKMGNIMYDTFFRSPFFPLGSMEDILSENVLPLTAETGAVYDAPTVCSYHAKRLEEWSRAFPGKVYIHENAMAQGYFGTFQYGTKAYLADLALYRKLGVQGVCYEAYEMGFSAFEKMFELLARAMRGEDIEYEDSPVEQAIRSSGMEFFASDPDFPLEKYLTDPFERRKNLLYRKFHTAPALDFFREYMDFILENEDRCDFLFMGFLTSKTLLQKKIITFSGLTPEERDFLSRRKLWDFMEDIPLSADPRAVCRNILQSLLRKAV